MRRIPVAGRVSRASPYSRTRFEHPVAGRPVPLDQGQQGLFDERRQAAPYVRGLRDGGGEVRGERRGDDRDPLEQVPVGRGEQFPAPVDHRPQARVPLRQAAQGVVEQREPVGQPGEHVVDRHVPQPRGGEFEGQRQVVEPVAQRQRPVGVPGRTPRHRPGPGTRSARARRRRAARSAGGPRSPARPSGARLVASTATSGEATATRSATTVATASRTCSQLSSTTSPSRSGRHGA